MKTEEQAVLLLKSGATLSPLLPLLKQLGLEARPMHPGHSDPALRGWFSLHPQGPGDLDAALERLQQAPGVDGAYRKPAGEAPS